MMMNQLLQSITNNSNNKGNDQPPSFLSILDAYQREKTMNEMIFQSLLSSSLQQQSAQSQSQPQTQQQQQQPQSQPILQYNQNQNQNQNQQQQQQQQQQQGNNPNYAALLAAAAAQNELNQQQQLLQQALMGRPIHNGLPAVMPSSANTVSDTALLALLQANRNDDNSSNSMGNNILSNNGASHAPGASPSTSQAVNSFSDSITSTQAPWSRESQLLGDNKIDIASALNGNRKASSLMTNGKAPTPVQSKNNGLNSMSKDLSTVDTAALLRLLTSAKTGGPAPASNMMQNPAPMASNVPAPAPAADAALLAMLQQLQQPQHQQPQINNMPPGITANNAASPSSTRASSPEHTAADFKSALGAVRVVNSLLTPSAPMRNGNTPSNPTSNLAMAVEIASSGSKADANKNIIINNSRSNPPPPTTSSMPSFIDPQNEDVLFGKGRTKHQGNRHLQKLIENLMAVYEAANKQQKKELADMVVTKILNTGGRFLKLDEEAQRWDEVEREDAHKKVAHAFRNLRRRNK